MKDMFLSYLFVDSSQTHFSRPLSKAQQIIPQVTEIWSKSTFSQTKSERNCGALICRSTNNKKELLRFRLSTHQHRESIEEMECGEM